MSTLSKLLLASLALVAACETGPRKSTEQKASEWAASMGMTWTHLQCMPDDSDYDGYVSCTFNTKQGIKTFDCADGWKGDRWHGCREPKTSSVIAY